MYLDCTSKKVACQHCKSLMGTSEGDNHLRLESSKCLIKHKRVHHAAGGCSALVEYTPEVLEEEVRLKRVVQGWIQETARLLAVAKVVKGVIRKRIKLLSN